MKALYALTSIALVSAASSTHSGAQQRPAIRQLGVTTARSVESLGPVTAIRHLPQGRVLVNDVARRRVVVFDSMLANFTVIADSTSATGSAYSGRLGGLIPYRGDSALFVDPTSLSMMVIDPTGKLGRVMSVPRPQDAMMLATQLGTPGFDAAGRLIYRGSPGRVVMPSSASGAPFVMPPRPDSAPIVRVDLATRKVDTLTFVRTPRVKVDVTQVDGQMSITTQVNPLPVVDEWAVLSDGSLAVVRGKDYHVDIFGADGKRVSAPKMAFEWQRLSDEDKVAFIDSVKAARERMLAAGSQELLVAGGGAVTTQSVPGGGGGPSVTYRIGPAGGGGAAPRPGTAVGAQNMTFVPPSDLPDYKPAFFTGSVRADADGNFWIRTIPTKAVSGGPVYDVVNNRGELVDRVQVPAQRTIVGFGSGGHVYMTVRENNTTFLERARLR